MSAAPSAEDVSRRVRAYDKKRIWFLDQYANPHEQTFTVDDVLAWFRQAGVEYVNSLPRSVSGRDSRPVSPCSCHDGRGRGSITS